MAEVSPISPDLQSRITAGWPEDSGKRSTTELPKQDVTGKSRR